MEYKYATYTSLLNKITKKDNLFIGDYTVDPYQNCEFGCKYCDSTFEKTVYVKNNATILLEEELNKIKEKGTIIIGSVIDPYQKIEKKHRATRKILNIIQQHNFPCHILTKSNLVLRDIDVLSKMDECIVTISITTLDNSISNVFEREVSPPFTRLQTVKKLSDLSIKTGIALIPVLPYIVEKELENIVKQVKEYGAQYLLHKHLELKGDQKNIFMRTLEDFFPDLVEKYVKLYKNRYMPDDKYILKINAKINSLCDEYKLKNSIY